MIERADGRTECSPGNADGGIYAKGATGFGTRLLIDLARNFTAPTS